MKTVLVAVRVLQEEKNRWVELAERRSMTLSAWVKWKCGSLVTVETGPKMIAAPARAVPLPASRGRSKPVLDECEPIPDDASLNALPPDAPLEEEMSLDVPGSDAEEPSAPIAAPVAIPKQTEEWPSGLKRSPSCITSKCEHLRTPTCDPCRRFNARSFE